MMERPLTLLRLLPLLLLILILPPNASPAAGLIRPPAPLVDLQVVDRDSGTALPQYRHDGQAWLPGDPGQPYAVRLRNLGGERVLVVLSVDGVNAVSGQTADPRQAGYVLGPWQSLDVDGWRKSLGTVARFVFVDPAASYAARTGRPDNIGVIGIAVFREAVDTPLAGVGGTLRERATKAQEALPAPAADAMARRESALPPGLGTGHGGIEASPAYTASFDRQSYPAQVTQLRYDTWAGLQARGIAVARAAWSDGPQAFPGGFVADPPCCEGWPR